MCRARRGREDGSLRCSLIDEVAVSWGSDPWEPRGPARYPESGLPFICIPGAGADVESLRGLAERLGRDRPVVGLRMPGTDGTTWPPDTMEGILEAFLPAVRRYQPQGPYLLGGSSFGGVVAYELAARLAADGARVAAVVLLDTYTARYPRSRRGLSLRDRIPRDSCPPIPHPGGMTAGVAGNPIDLSLRGGLEWTGGSTRLPPEADRQRQGDGAGIASAVPTEILEGPEM